MLRIFLVRVSWLLVYFFSLVPGVFSQDINFINYDIRDGLAGSNVYDVAQDADGFIWFATEEGLSRFDGKNFKTFTVKDGLPDNEIIKIFVDSKNRVWFMPFKPAIAYYYNGKIFNAQNDSLVRQLKFQTNPFSMAEDRNGNIAITENRQYHLLYRDKKPKTAITGEGVWVAVGIAGVNASGNLQLSAVFYARPGELMPGQPKIFDPLTLQSRNFNQHGNASMTNGLLNPRVTVISLDDSLRVFLSDGNIFDIPSSDGNVDYLDNDQLAVSRSKGVDLYDLGTLSFTGHLLNQFKINSVFFDKEGNYWFATRGSGVIMVPSFNFRNFSTVNDSIALSVNSLTSYRSKLLIGSEEGQVWELDPVTNHFRSLNHLLHQKSGGRITDVKRLDDNTLIAGSDFGFSSSFPVTLPLPAIVLQQFLRSSVKSMKLINQTVLIASYRSVSLVDFKKNTIVEIRDGRATCALSLDSGYYIGTLSGLYFVDKHEKQFYLGTLHDGLRARIVAMDTTSDGTLWVATKGNGLLGYRKGAVRYILGEKNGINSVNGTALFISGDTIWLGTEKGLNRISKNERGEISIRQFTTTDGLASNKINAVAQIGSKMFVGTSKGLTVFDANESKPLSNCNMVFTGIYVAGQSVVPDSNRLVLEHSKNDIRFEYAGISFKSGNDISFRYRLVGLHNDFRTTRENSLNFPSLPSGTFTFEIMATNAYGVESEWKAFRFTIKKAFWEKPWVWLSAIGVVTMLVILAFMYRVNKIKKREIEKTKANRRIAELEQIALRSQINPHFIFNSLNSIQQYVVEKDIVGANTFITDFSNLIRMTLDYSVKKEITLAEELFYIETYLKVEKSRLENKFAYSIMVDPAINAEAYTLPPLLVQPFVENSIRHGIKNLTNKKGMIAVTVKQDDGFLIISVADNGIGRDASRVFKKPFNIQYQSKGMSLSRERIDSYNKMSGKKARIEIEDLRSDSGNPEGTRINIYTPID